MSPCCDAPMMKFSSGGSKNKAIKGAYYLCGCGKEHMFDYDTGELKNEKVKD